MLVSDPDAKPDPDACTSRSAAGSCFLLLLTLVFDLPTFKRHPSLPFDHRVHSHAPSIRPIEEPKWFFRFPANESLRKTGLHWSISAKSSFYLPAFEISRSCHTASGNAGLEINTYLTELSALTTGFCPRTLSNSSFESALAVLWIRNDLFWILYFRSFWIRSAPGSDPKNGEVNKDIFWMYIKELQQDF